MQVSVDVRAANDLREVFYNLGEGPYFDLHKGSSPSLVEVVQTGADSWSAVEA